MAELASRFGGMDELMARLAQRQAIVDIEPEFRKVGEGFHVMGMEISSPAVSATPATVAVAPEHIVAPSSIVSGEPLSSALRKSPVSERMMLSATPLLCAGTHGNSHFGPRHIAVLSANHWASTTLHGDGKFVFGFLRKGNASFRTGAATQACIWSRRPGAPHTLCLPAVKARSIDIEHRRIAPLFAFRTPLQPSRSPRSIFFERHTAFCGGGLVDAERGVGHG